jgi:hypothetical protein
MIRVVLVHLAFQLRFLLQVWEKERVLQYKAHLHRHAHFERPALKIGEHSV